MSDGNARKAGSRKRKSRGGGNKPSTNKASGSQPSNGKAANNTAASKSSGKKRSRSRNRSRSKKVDPAKYWGDVASLPELDEHVISTPDPSVVVNSLGRPPIPGHENASKHYFNLVYDRASQLAVALAAAGGLSDFGTTMYSDDDDGADDDAADDDGADDDDLDDNMDVDAPAASAH